MPLSTTKTTDRKHPQKHSPLYTTSEFISAVILVLLIASGVYFLFIAALVIPILQAQVIYLNKVKLTWGQDVNIPEQWGFLHNQVTPFELHTPDGETLHAWHILPLDLYRRHEASLAGEEAGLASDITARKSFALLRDDPDALLVFYFHGAAGTLGSGFRPPSYRAISSGASSRIHIVAIDYRGFGISTGTPTEEGLLADALTLTNWATQVAGIDPRRIVLFGQSLGTAVSVAVAKHHAEAQTPMFFRGIVLVAPFEDVETLTATYKVAGTLPILSPLAKVPSLLRFFHRFIRTHWPTKQAIQDLVRSCEQSTDAHAGYHITIIHAQDDYDIPWSHSENLYWSAVTASMSDTDVPEDLAELKTLGRVDLGEGGWYVHRATSKGTLRQEITKYGLHDRIMGYPIVGLAIHRAFEHTDGDVK